MVEKSLSASLAKTHLLELLEAVDRRSEPFVITKRGRPVARLIPIQAPQPAEIFGCMRGTFRITGDIVSPEPDTWGGHELILLDTHVWLWLAAGEPTIRPPARKLILEASRTRSLFLSPISLWEVALKSSRGKLELASPLRHWITQAVELTRVELLPISPEIACDCADLPPAFHGDPADRIIAASARVSGFTLLTHDKALLQLARNGYFKAVAT